MFLVTNENMGLCLYIPVGEKERITYENDHWRLQLGALRINERP